MRHAAIKKVRDFRRRYGDSLLTVLTVLLVVMLFVIAPLQAALDGGLVLFTLPVAILMILTVLILSGSWTATLLMVLALGLNAFVALNRVKGGAGDFDLHLLAVSWLINSLTLGVVVARAVFAEGRVSYHRIVGAVLLYLLIALAFVALYLAVGLTFDHAFSNLDIEDGPELASRLIYFSCATLTTLGYGDMAPVHPLARSLSNLEAICGQLYPAILIARVVTLHVQGGR